MTFFGFKPSQTASMWFFLVSIEMFMVSANESLQLDGQRVLSIAKIPWGPSFPGDVLFYVILCYFHFFPLDRPLFVGDVSEFSRCLSSKCKLYTPRSLWVSVCMSTMWCTRIGYDVLWH